MDGIVEEIKVIYWKWLSLCGLKPSPYMFYEWSLSAGNCFNLLGNGACSHCLLIGWFVWILRGCVFFVGTTLAIFGLMDGYC